MVVITGGHAAGDVDSESRPAFLSPAEERVAEALLRCMGRWGLSKTTIEDVAREAGVSRATVYRLFPGGKQAILDAAAQAEVRALLFELGTALSDVEELDECLVAAIHRAACFLDRHEALSFMREHEPVALEQVLAFDRLDTLFQTAGTLFQPVLERFLAPEQARDAGIWLTRLVVSYLDTESPQVDLCDEHDVRRLVEAFVLPGLSRREPSAGVDIDLRGATGARTASPSPTLSDPASHPTTTHPTTTRPTTPDPHAGT